MTDFVHEALEKELLPVFEQLQLIQLYSRDEIKEMIDKCRAFEYKISKLRKLPKDFFAYATYLRGQLTEIQRRRREAKFTHRYDQIERPLKQKCAFIYRICTQRFKKLEFHNEEIAFLKDAKMFGQCSRAFTRLLQLHGHLPECHERACRFEFFHNHSAENARTIVLFALRKFPQHSVLWAAHFELELRYAGQLLKRRDFFQSRGGEGEEDQMIEEGGNQSAGDDELLQFKLARIVYELAMKTLESGREKKKLVRRFLGIARQCGDYTKALARDLAEHLEHMEGAEGGEEEMDEDEEGRTPDEELFEIDIQGTGIVGIDGEEEINEGTNEGEMEMGGIEGKNGGQIEGKKAEEKKTMMKGKKEGGKGKKQMKKKKSKNSVLDGYDPNDESVKKLLAKATLTADFDQKPLDEVLISAERRQKRERKAAREQTKGRGWFGMPATELDDERRRDLELVQMRDALDPKQHYKRPDREVLPKYFQIGHIVESKADFYSARVPKKQRKRTVAEELMADHETIARNKRRYGEIVRRKEATRNGRALHRGGRLGKHSKRKNKIKSH